MAKVSEQKLLAALREIDTPTITNVVATYPTNPLCLGLYNPWTENWYTDTSIRCIYPEMGPVIGYAVTCVYGMPDPNYPEPADAIRTSSRRSTPRPSRRSWSFSRSGRRRSSTRPAWLARS